LCEHCTAKCCRYFALPIEEPTGWKDFEFIRWYLLHDRATVFIEDDVWYLLVHTRCKHLRDDNLCGIYETRPQICRDYSTKRCEYEDDWVYDHYFETPEQIEEYAEAVLGPRKGRDFRSPRPR
jgi:Fe-S-cluster containining protein